MFYDKYVKLCAKKEISPSAAAEEMGFERSNVTRWSKGVEPRRATLERVAAYFGVPVTFFQENERPVPYIAPIGVCHVPFTDIFKRNVSAEVETLDHVDIEDSGQDYNELMELLKEGSPVSLEDACEISDWLGTPLDELTRETYDPRKKIPPAEKTAQGDALEETLLGYISQMTEKEKRVLLSAFESLLAQGSAPSASAPETFAEIAQEVAHPFFS